jgi:glycosyltransferase involved in cell wall biosynthesis
MSSIKSPLVSIIMNCHNGEKYLNTSIKSILSQSYNNWELIFWDNNSQDNSKKILLKYKDKRIKYFKSKKLLKLYHARNLAVNKAKGKYISFLDVDDYWSKNKLKKQVSFFSKNQNYKILYSNFYVIDKKKKIKKKKVSINYLPSGAITQKIIDNYKVGILTVMLNKSLFKKIKFKNTYSIIGDFDLIVRLSLKFKIGCIQEPLAYYRVHNSNFSRNYKLHIEELIDWLKKNRSIMQKNSFILNSIRKQIGVLMLKNYIKLLGRVVQW